MTPPRRRGARGIGAALAAACALALPMPVAADQPPPANWQLDALGAEQVWQTTRGEGVQIGMIDNGITPDLPDLAGQVAEVRVVHEDATNQHGSGMASVIVGTGADTVRGLAPGARLRAVQLDRTLPPTSVDDNDDQLFRDLVDAGVGVINLSWGDDEVGLGPLTVDRVRDGIAYALEHDVVVVAAAGNTPDSTAVNFPASYPGVVAVTATERDGGFCDCSVAGPEVALAAPGRAVTVAEPDGPVVVDGTSVPAGLVSAAAALVRAAHPHLDAANVVNRLVTTARDAGPAGRDDQFGFGIVDPVAAVTADVPPVDANPLLAGREGAPTGRATPDDDGTMDEQAAADDAFQSELDAALADASADVTGPPVGLLVGVAVLALLLVLGLVLLLVRRGRTTD